MGEWLPLWVYEVIAELDKYENEHAKESNCFDPVFRLVPKPEVERARAIAYYRENCTAEETT